MSLISVMVLRNEAGVETNPGTNQLLQTNCVEGSQSLKKTFREVFVHWNGVDAWVEDAVYNPLALDEQVALRVDNICTGEYSYILMPYNDFRIKQLCCITEELGDNMFLITEDGDGILTEDGQPIMTEG